MKILLTGGSGLLGTHLTLTADRPFHHQLDITKINKFDTPYDLIIHAAAYTDVAGAEKEKLKCFETNVWGTLNLLEMFKGIPFVYISSEYAKSPVNFYSRTKKMAEQLVQCYEPYLIIRTLFKPRPWKYPKAFIDQHTRGDYVDIIAPMIEDEIKAWDKKTSKLIYVGTERKTIFELARQTRNVEPISVDDIKDVKIPKDYL